MLDSSQQFHIMSFQVPFDQTSTTCFLDIFSHRYPINGPTLLDKGSSFYQIPQSCQFGGTPLSLSQGWLAAKVLLITET